VGIEPPVLCSEAREGIAALQDEQTASDMSAVQTPPDFVR